MPRKTTEAKAARTKRIIAGLQRTYPDAHCELNFSSPLELLVATILSAQCTDKRVNIVTKDLFQKYRTAAAYADAPAGKLEEAIRTTGFYRNKARNIRQCCRALADRFGGRVPETMAELFSLDGIGRKTANVILGNAFGKSEGVVVDTHVMRLSQRLGLTRQKDPVKIEQEQMKLVPPEYWTLWSHWLIWHGRRRCFARNPDCENCEVNHLCPKIGVKK